MTETFLQLHERLLKTGLLQINCSALYNGLCNVEFQGKSLYLNDIFAGVAIAFRKENITYGAYWASDIDTNNDDAVYGETRQSLVLRCAAINGEL